MAIDPRLTTRDKFNVLFFISMINLVYTHMR